MSYAWFVVAAAVLAVVAARIWHSRHQRLARLRAEWGRPVTRTRRLDTMAASHASRVAITRGRSLDSRTWADLNLDDVLIAIDRTESTLGQHALYHRLRSVPVADHPAAFEALVTRMSTDAAARECAQLALARLQDPHGYDLWWLERSDAVERRAWHAIFPLLTVTGIAAIALAPIWPGLLLAVVVLNLAVRYGTDRQIGAMARRFRQCAPVIATAEGLAFLAGDDIAPIVGSLREDVAQLSRLKLISRWASDNPFMLSFTSSPWAIAMSDLAGAIYEYLNVVLVLDATGVFFGVRDLRARGGALLRVVAAAGEVDAAISVAAFRAGGEVWTRPQFQPPGGNAGLIALRHPLVDHAVPNSITLQSGSGVLVTGSNMSGKAGDDADRDCAAAVERRAEAAAGPGGGHRGPARSAAGDHPHHTVTTAEPAVPRIRILGRGYLHAQQVRPFGARFRGRAQRCRLRHPGR